MAPFVSEIVGTFIETNQKYMFWAKTYPKNSFELLLSFENERCKLKRPVFAVSQSKASFLLIARCKQ